MGKISRRIALKSGISLGTLGISANNLFAAQNKSLIQPNFAEPISNLRTHVKMIGSLGKEIVYSFMRLNIYADLGEGNYIPFFTMNNVLVDYWEPQEDNQHEMRKYEVGFYTKYDSYELLDYFDNPITGKRNPVHHFRLGPVPRMYTPEGVIAMGYTPKLLPIEVIGERVFLATESIESRPDPVRPGQMTYVNSFMTVSAQLSDSLNLKIKSVATHMQLQNKNKWAPWMEMGDRSGGTIARGFGAKIRNLDVLPQPVKDGIKKYVPEILDTAHWTKFLFEDSEYTKRS